MDIKVFFLPTKNNTDEEASFDFGLNIKILRVKRYDGKVVPFEVDITFSFMTLKKKVIITGDLDFWKIQLVNRIGKKEARR